MFCSLVDNTNNLQHMKLFRIEFNMSGRLIYCSATVENSLIRQKTRNLCYKSITIFFANWLDILKIIFQVINR